MTLVEATHRWQPRLARWVTRYGAAEAGGLALAFLVAGVVTMLSGDRVLAAYGGALAETTGFYMVMSLREIATDRRAVRGRGDVFGARDLACSLRTIALELGPSELVDATFVRPAAMAAGMTAFGPHLGLLAGKLAADAVFYGLAAWSYERRRAWSLRERERAIGARVAVCTGISTLPPLESLD